MFGRNWGLEVRHRGFNSSTETVLNAAIQMRHTISLLFSICWGVLQSTPCATIGYKLSLVEDDAGGLNAACLDGSPPGYWVEHAPTHPPNTNTTSSTNQWVVHIVGGGWCYNETDCWARAGFFSGSSLSWSDAPPLGQPLGGPLNRNCSVNPDFCNFNYAVVG